MYAATPIKIGLPATNFATRFLRRVVSDISVVMEFPLFTRASLATPVAHRGVLRVAINHRKANLSARDKA